MNSHSRPGPRAITPFLLSSPLSPQTQPQAGPHQTEAVAQSPTEGQTEEPRSPTSHLFAAADLSRTQSARSARLSSSILPALRLAGLAPHPDRDRDREKARARDMRSSSSRSSKDSSKPRPLVVLKLSGSSFLDSVIRDDKSKDPLYILETAGENTHIYRLDHPRDEPIKAATIQWPAHPVRVKGKSGRSIQFGNGSWREAEDVLKSGPLGNNAIRKFNLPHYPHSLKWKLIPGNCFCCVTSGIKGPVAVLDAATLSAPPRIKIYDSLIDKEAARSQDNYKGLPTVLLDYLIITALLLVTDVQEWLDRPREARIPGSSSYTIQRWLALIHHRPAPPEPEHPTVDLSLTVPSTPPQSATLPSPGGVWDTQSRVTSMSGSNGSGSGASYIGEPFTPTTPATPATPATSAHSSMLFSQQPGEDVPPVPPMPTSSSSPFMFNVNEPRPRERPKSNPQTSSHSPTARGLATQQPSPHIAGTTSLPCQSVSASAPTSPYPISAGPSTASSSSSSRIGRRRLPTPPAPAPPHSFAQPWLYHSSSGSSSSSASASTATPGPSSSLPSPPVGPPTTSAGGNTATRAAARVSMRGSLRTAAIPPPPPPPLGSIPLPPKLAQEQELRGNAHPRPHTAPDLQDGRRRHSAGEFGTFSQAVASVRSADAPASMHPYAQASYASSSERDAEEHMARMQGLRMGSSTGRGSGHVRGPSQPAPDYDTHSFVNMPPPLPTLPIPQTPIGSGMRSPLSSSGRRVLTVVNGDANSLPVEDPGLLLHSERERRMRLQQQQQQQQQARMSSYAESVYEMPPPAYDAIDFSVPPVPALPRPQQQRTTQLHQSPSIPQMAPLPIVPLPRTPVEAGAEGQRGS